MPSILRLALALLALCAPVRKEGRVIAAHQTMLEKKMLPYDSEVEWLYRSESDAFVGPYIITDVLLENNPIIEMSVMPDAGSSFCWVAGARRFNSPGVYCNMAVDVAGGKVRAVYGASTAQESTFSISTSTFSTFKMTKNALSVNGVAVKTYSGTVGTQFSSSGEPKCGIFTLYQTGGESPFQSGGAVKIAWCKIWNDDGATLVFDGKAVRAGSVGFLYDAVSGNLYGNAASTGSFGVGPDK